MVSMPGGAPLAHTLLARQNCFWPWDEQPYLLSLSLKRLEIVGDILQLFLQLGTFTAGFCKERGEKTGKEEAGGKDRRDKSESTCGEEREARWEAVCSDRTGTRALRKASSLPAPKSPL